jgi:uncharacterized membrane protein
MADPITKSIIVKGELSDVYRIWANFENFPRFMETIKSVKLLGDRLSHWVMQGPLGAPLEWDAETTRLDENERIAWNSKDNSALKTSGQVTFKSLKPNETEITVTMMYDPPAGLVGEVVAQLFGNPEGRLEADLRRFKEYVEESPTRIREARASSKQGSL